MTSSAVIDNVITGPVLITGAGVSGLGCARALAHYGVEVTVVDDNTTQREFLAQQGIGLIDTAAAMQLLGSPQFREAAPLVVTSPGWRPDNPLLLAAAESGYSVIGDIELAWRLDRAGVFGPPHRWLVVTGTNGKTTTTGMLAAIMSAQTQQPLSALGNAGVSVFDALLSSHQQRLPALVVELSSFQLHWAPTLAPEVAVLLNLADDHLDWHGSFAHYAAAKARVFQASSAVILGLDDPAVVRLLATEAGAASSAKSRTAPHDTGHQNAGHQDTGHQYAGHQNAGQIGGFITGDEALPPGVAAGAVVRISAASPADDPVLQLPGSEPELSLAGIEPAGRAGHLDAAAAAAAAWAAGASREAISQGLSQYRVAGHRGEIVHRSAGVTWIDNSKATNPHAADAALTGIARAVWIAGGQLKGARVAELISRHRHRLAAVVVLGQDRHLIWEDIRSQAPELPVTMIDSTDPHEAMSAAVAAAATHAEPGDTVILAPAAASLDMYTGMAQRGDIFAAAARAQH